MKSNRLEMYNRIFVDQVEEDLTYIHGLDVYMANEIDGAFWHSQQNDYIMDVILDSLGKLDE